MMERSNRDKARQKECRQTEQVVIFCYDSASYEDEFGSARLITKALYKHDALECKGSSA